MGGQWRLVYNSLSFGIAGMGSATIFFWLQLANVNKAYRTALNITGLVTAIATYHYIRIFNSWVDAFTIANKDGGDYVMKLSKEETVKLSWNLGVASAVMVAIGYPGEIQENLLMRWIFWAFAMVPFAYVVMTLVAGLNGATDKQPDSVKSLVVSARYLTVISWLTYPGVYIIKSMGLAGNVATTYEQVGYSVADVVAKAVFGVLIWAIAAGKSAEEGLLG